MGKTHDELAAATVRSLTTTAECCSDGISEANVVDGLYMIARALNRIADAIKSASDKNDDS